jgi:hypothetical protein
LPALLLCFFLGWAGAHRFYVGKIGTGILMLLTGGVFGVLWLIDFILLIVGAFTDKAGNRLTEWIQGASLDYGLGALWIERACDLRARSRRNMCNELPTRSTMAV